MAFGGLGGPLGAPVALWELGGPLRTGGFLRGWGRRIGTLWGWVRGPHNTVQMKLVYYNDHRVSPLNSLLKSLQKSSFKMSLSVSPK